MSYAMAGLMAALLSFSGSSAQQEAFASYGPLPDSATDTPGLDDLPSVQVSIPHEQDDALVGFAPDGTAFVANPAYAPIALGDGFQLVVLDFPYNAEVAAIAVYALGTEVAKAATDQISKGINTEAESQGFEVFPNLAIPGVPVVPGGNYTLRLLSAMGEVLHETGLLALTSNDAERSGYGMAMPSRPAVGDGNGTPQMTMSTADVGPSSSYTFCVYENNYCSFTGKRNVAYGYNGAFYYKYGITSGINCTNAVFGDPYVGHGKACYISGETSTTYVAPTGYTTLCAYETQYCSASGTVDIAYGNSGSYYYKYGVTGGTTCSHTNFGGDPIYGVHKACWTKPSGSTGTTYVGPADYSASPCAYEDGYCAVTGTMDVAYGNGGLYYYKYGVTGGTTCSHTNFGGDPNFGVHKACWTKATGGSPGTTYVGPSGYSTAPCAYENQYCAVGSATMDIAYGNGGLYYYKYGITGGTTCSYTNFGGDPNFGVHKACWTKPTSTGGCTGTFSTWATQSVEPRYENTYGNTYDVNHNKLASEAWSVQWDYGYYQGNCGYTSGTDRRFAYANDFSGRSDIVGLGHAIYGFTLDYRGGRDMTQQCVGGTCDFVGYSNGVSQAEVFMKTPPAQVVPTYVGLSKVSIPQSSGENVPELAKFALDQMVEALNTWGGIPGMILGFASPNAVQMETYSQVTTNKAGSTGGGIRVNTQVYGDQKIVSGLMDWEYKGLSSGFEYQLQPTIKEDSMFHACFDCNWVEGHNTWYTNMVHKARVRPF